LLGRYVYDVCKEYEDEFVIDDDLSKRFRNYFALITGTARSFANRFLEGHLKYQSQKKIISGLDMLDELIQSEDHIERLAGTYVSAVYDAKKDFLANKEENFNSLGIDTPEFEDDFFISKDEIETMIALLRGKNIIFASPFYRDFREFLFFPINRVLLHEKRLLVIDAYDTNHQDLVDWLEDGFVAATCVPNLWQIAHLEDDYNEIPQVGILSATSLNDFDFLERQKHFLSDVGFVILLSPSRSLCATQLGFIHLTDLLQNSEDITYIAFDINTDGLVDTLSHTLQAQFIEVSATSGKSVFSYGLLWDADGRDLHTDLFDNVSQYLGVGTEIAAYSLHMGIEKTTWRSASAVPIKDVRWIAGQYYQTLAEYGGFEVAQSNLDEVIDFATDVWNIPREKHGHYIVEDENYNLLEMQRQFSTRSTYSSFINVISSNYLLRDFMRYNEQIFFKDPKVLPLIVADADHTERNYLIDLIAQLHHHTVDVKVIQHNLSLIGIEVEEADIHQYLLDRMNYYGLFGKDLVTGSEIKAETYLPHPESRTYFDVETGRNVSVDCLSLHKPKDQPMLPSLEYLKTAYYISEDDVNKGKKLGSCLYGLILQKYLPGQFVTIDGKYYEVLKTNAEAGMLVRRASDHFDKRLYYRQLKEVSLSGLNNNKEAIFERKISDGNSTVDIAMIPANVQVECKGYLRMTDYADVRNAVFVDTTDDAEVSAPRNYKNKRILRVAIDDHKEFASELEKMERDKQIITIAAILNEVFKTTYAVGNEYLLVVPRLISSLSREEVDDLAKPATKSAQTIVKENPEIIDEFINETQDERSFVTEKLDNSQEESEDIVFEDNDSLDPQDNNESEESTEQKEALANEIEDSADDAEDFEDSDKNIESENEDENNKLALDELDSDDVAKDDEDEPDGLEIMDDVEVNDDTSNSIAASANSDYIVASADLGDIGLNNEKNDDENFGVDLDEQVEEESLVKKETEEEDEVEQDADEQTDEDFKDQEDDLKETNELDDITEFEDKKPEQKFEDEYSEFDLENVLQDGETSSNDRDAAETKINSTYRIKFERNTEHKKVEPSFEDLKNAEVKEGAKNLLNDFRGVVQTLRACDDDDYSSCIYIVEDSMLDIGLVSSVERNMERFLSLTLRFLQWHNEMLSSSDYPVLDFSGQHYVNRKHLLGISIVEEREEEARKAKEALEKEEAEKEAQNENQDKEDKIPEDSIECHFCYKVVEKASVKSIARERAMCPDCCNDCLKKAGEIKKLAQETADDMQEKFGISFSVPSFKVAGGSKYNSKVSKTPFPIAPPHSKYVALTSKAFLFKKKQILVEKNMPRIAIKGCVVHELTHAWQSEQDFFKEILDKDHGREICEGMAAWAYVQYLFASGFKEAAYDLIKALLRRDDEIGHGYKYYYTKYPHAEEMSQLKDSPFKHPEGPITEEDIEIIENSDDAPKGADGDAKEGSDGLDPSEPIVTSGDQPNLSKPEESNNVSTFDDSKGLPVYDNPKSTSDREGSSDQSSLDEKDTNDLKDTQGEQNENSEDEKVSNIGTYHFPFEKKPEFNPMTGWISGTIANKDADSHYNSDLRQITDEEESVATGWRSATAGGSKEDLSQSNNFVSEEDKPVQQDSPVATGWRSATAASVDDANKENKITNNDVSDTSFSEEGE
ncbi:MAG: hypothetical protein MJ189_00410, partial [Coriobacteriales bacterium]|nr:hypothetical protein [Coriobacteriales bacterium]